MLISFFSFSQEEISLIDFAKGDYPLGKKIKIIYNKSQSEMSNYQINNQNNDFSYNEIFIDSLFYREVTFKDLNIPDGPTKDYYLSGQLMALFYSNYLGLNNQAKDSIFYNGPLYTYHKNGKNNSKASFVNNILEGDFATFYDSGEIKTMQPFRSGLINGKSKFYNKTYPFGQPREVWDYENGIPNGMAQRFYENGKINSEIVINNGKLIGPEIGYYENGNISYKTIYNDGKAGKITRYHNTGELKGISNWIDGMMNGEEKYYYKSGKLKLKLNWKNDSKQGQEIGYYESGKKQYTVNYVDNLRQLKENTYYESGEESSEVNYIDNLKQGLMTYYSKKGDVDYDELYLDDKRVDRKIALVIGNAAYEKGSLENPVNDANLIAGSLKKLDFEVELYSNLSTRDEMLDAIKDFGRKRADYEIGFVYYAGHGIQLNNENYLLPVNEEFEYEEDVEDNGVSMQRVLRYLESTRENQLNFIVLDACRDNPFESNWNKTRSLKGGGLAKIPPPTGSLIAYSTDHGQTAADGDGGNSLYSKALAEKLLEEDVSIEQVFKNVRTEVLRLSNKTQIPVEESKLTGDVFYLNKTEE